MDIKLQYKGNNHLSLRQNGELVDTIYIKERSNEAGLRASYILLDRFFNSNLSIYNIKFLNGKKINGVSQYNLTDIFALAYTKQADKGYIKTLTGCPVSSYYKPYRTKTKAIIKQSDNYLIITKSDNIDTLNPFIESYYKEGGNLVSRIQHKSKPSQAKKQSSQRGQNEAKSAKKVKVPSKELSKQELIEKNQIRANRKNIKNAIQQIEQALKEPIKIVN